MERTKVDLCFPIYGKEIPVDHGYALFSAVAKLVESPERPLLHGNEEIGIHPIRGRYQGNGRLAVCDFSRLAIRLAADAIHDFLPLAGKAVNIGGHPLRFRIPQPHTLKPSAVLYAHLVTTKNRHIEARFDEEIARQLATLNIKAKPRRGQRKTLRIKDKTVVAYGLVVSELDAEESIRLQETGLGGRRRLGCGIFVPMEQPA